MIDRAATEFGGIDVVSNATFQMTHSDLGEISDEEWDYAFRLNVGRYFYLVKAALPHMGPGSSAIGSSSVNSDMPSPTLAPYAATKAVIANFSDSLAQLLGEKGIRVNSVAPGPIWTPLYRLPCPRRRSRISVRHTPWPSGPTNPPNSHRCTYCWLRTKAVISPVREGGDRRPARVVRVLVDGRTWRSDSIISRGPRRAHKSCRLAPSGRRSQPPSAASGRTQTSFVIKGLVAR